MLSKITLTKNDIGGYRQSGVGGRGNLNNNINGNNNRVNNYFGEQLLSSQLKNMRSEDKLTIDRQNKNGGITNRIQTADVKKKKKKII